MHRHSKEPSHVYKKTLRKPFLLYTIMKVRKSSDHAHGPPNATVEWTRSEPTRLVRLISFVLRHKSRRRRGDVQERPNVYASKAIALQGKFMHSLACSCRSAPEDFCRLVQTLSSCLGAIVFSRRITVSK